MHQNVASNECAYFFNTANFEILFKFAVLIGWAKNATVRERARTHKKIENNILNFMQLEIYPDNGFVVCWMR